jgi:hypothetical protein
MDEEIPKYHKKSKKKKYRIVFTHKENVGNFFKTWKQNYTSLKASEDALERFHNKPDGWPSPKNYTAKIIEL